MSMQFNAGRRDSRRACAPGEAAQRGLHYACSATTATVMSTTTSLCSATET